MCKYIRLLILNATLLRLFYKIMKNTRNTKAKKEILNLINKTDSALSHSEIHLNLNGLCDRVTVYRVLKRLLKEGSIHKIIDIDGVTKYASCHNCSTEHNHNHIHFSCQKCGTLTCLEGIYPSFELPHNYTAEKMNFTVSGLCPKCS